MAEIILSPSEIMIAATVGVMRQLNNIRGGRQHLYGGKVELGWQYHIEGAMGECAVAKFKGVYWSSGKRGAADVGDDQVRTTSGANNRLIIHLDDNDDDRFWLVTGLNGKYEVVGWTYGFEAKKDEYWQDPQGGRPAFFFPQSELYENP